MSSSHKPAVALLLSLLFCAVGAAADTDLTVDIRVIRFFDNSRVEFLHQKSSRVLTVGERIDSWTLMAVAVRYAVLENFERQDGHILFVDTRGVRLDLPKSLEPTFSDHASLYLGHTLDEIKSSANDLLGDQILAESGDPDYGEVARVFPPIRVMNTYTFVGAPDTFDKIGFTYGGRTPNFDPAPYFPPLISIRDSGNVWNGLVGGDLPVLRFVYPDTRNDWTEMIAFAPLRAANGNNRVQPVWYRVARIEGGVLRWAKYIDSYHPFPPRVDYDPKLFYADLSRLKSGWDTILKGAMRIDIPDQRLANMARHSLIRSILTRVGDFPKYGVFDRDYGGSEHDGFPDTFTVETTAMLDWGLLDRAGRYIGNYFGEFVRDDGSILYRGPETGQYGRMLAVVARYAELGGDPAVLLRWRSRIDGVTKLLLTLRAKALTLPKDDPAYGMIAGWSEADASLDPQPARYMQPYFSNSTEAIRGFQDLGIVWQQLGRKKSDPELAAWGARLVREAAAMRTDLAASISRSLLTVDGKTILPAIAGVKEPFHIAVARDGTDPQFRSYRAYMEMMYSGVLTKKQIEMIVNYRASHHDVLLGMPTAYGVSTGDLAGFLSYGYGYGLMQTDHIREALLLLYSDMAHQYTRGTWTAPETRAVFGDNSAAPYCTPAQLVVPMMARWLLVFEDPESGTLWLGKGVPRKWLEDGKRVAASAAPTKWGQVGFEIVSHIDAGGMEARVEFPGTTFAAATTVRLRAPGGKKLKSVALNGKPWEQFDAAAETITLPPNSPKTSRLVARFE